MLLIETQILAPILTYVKAVSKGGILIESFENYQKKSFRNRFWIATVSGKETFSIPLKKGKSNQSPIQSVKISYEDMWVRKLKFMFMTNYGSAPYFEYYFDELMDLFEAGFETLWELNNELLNWSNKVLDISLKIELTETYNSIYNAPIEDFRNKHLSFYESTTSKELGDYDQIFIGQVGFIRNLSIVDLIMNKGPEAGYIISQSAKRINHN